MQDYEGWILGMAVTDGGHLVIRGDTWGDTIRTFDAASGAKQRELRPQTPVFGLSCVTRE